MTDHGVYSINPTIRWKDIIELNIPNENLKRRVQTFLDLFEKSAFRYDFMDSATGQIEDRYLSGQDILARMSGVRANLLAWKEQHDGSKVAEYLANTSIVKNGKFFLAQHNRPFDRGAMNGTQSMFVGNPTIGAFPLGLEIGTDYLRGARYLGVDNNLHPVTVDAAIVHEMAHIAYNTSDEDIPIMVEGIVASALGAVQRANMHSIDFKKDVNGGFWLLAHKIKSGGMLAAEFDSKVRSDFGCTAEASHYDVSQAMVTLQVTPQPK